MDDGKRNEKQAEFKQCSLGRARPWSGVYKGCAWGATESVRCVGQDGHALPAAPWHRAARRGEARHVRRGPEPQSGKGRHF